MVYVEQMICVLGHSKEFGYGKNKKNLKSETNIEYTKVRKGKDNNLS